ncbi:hypothetical protein [Methylorubrum extorquens]
MMKVSVEDLLDAPNGAQASSQPAMIEVGNFRGLLGRVRGDPQTWVA